MTSSAMQFMLGQSAEDNAVLVEYAASRLHARIADEKAAVAAGKETHRRDFMHYLLNAEDPKTGWRPSSAELEADSLSLIGAGADTIATVLAATLFYLLRNKPCLAKVTAEVREAFASPDEIHAGPKLESKCTYLAACIEEAMRLSPPVASVLPREVMPGGVVIDGEFIPAGTVVGVPPYALQHDEDIYPDPWAFRPQRWIAGREGMKGEDVRRAQAAMSPFSHGSRGCIGKALAYLEMKIALARLLFLMDIRESEVESASDSDSKVGEKRVEEGREREDEYQLTDCFGADRHGPILEFRRREGW